MSSTASLAEFSVNPDYFLDEFINMLKTNQFISVHFTTIFHELERIDISYNNTQMDCEGTQ
jgi:hypothetical protein